MPDTIALTDEGIDQTKREIAKLLEISQHCRNMANRMHDHRDAIIPHYGSQIGEAIQVHIEQIQELSDHYRDMAVMLARTLEQYDIFDHELASCFAQLGE